MQVEVGAVLSGKVTGITNFGAFVLLPSGETGMVHISEVSISYIENIKDHLKEDQEVNVKVLAINENGKIALSIKQALPEYIERSQRGPRQGGKDRSPQGGGGGRDKPRRQPNVWQGQKQEQDTQNRSFEDMMASFKKSSEEKIGSIKRQETRNNRRGS